MGVTARWRIALLTVLCGVAMVSLVPFIVDGAGLTEPGLLVTLAGAAGLVGIVALLLLRVPENRVSWVLFVTTAALFVALGAQEHGAGVWVDALTAVALFGFIVPGSAVLVPLWFPTGRPPTPRWRVVEWVTAAAVALFLTGFAIVAWVEHGDTSGVSGCESLGTCSGFAGVVLLLSAICVAIVSFIVRWRRSEGVERLQLKWLVPSLIVFGAGNVAEFGFQGSIAADVLLPLGFMLMVVSISVAILRYRLYDIDRLISRSVAYAIVLVVLGAGFGAAVAFPTLVVGDESTPSWVVAGSTLAVAAAFNPLRMRVQRLVDRRFDRVRYDAQRVVDRFGGALRDATDIGEIGESLRSVVVEAFQPARVGLWMRDRA